MHLVIITPEQVVLETDEAEQVILPAAGGELGILPGHVAMGCRLTVGRIRVDRPGEEPLELATSGGFAEVLADRVLVMAETAERAEDIDEARAVAARDRARAALLHHEADVDNLAAQAALARAINRIRIVGGA